MQQPSGDDNNLAELHDQMPVMEDDSGDQTQGAIDTLPDQPAVPKERDAAALEESLTAEREAVLWACPPETQR